ncbi:MAG: LptF/LptG family permease [Spirochaetes bacterium]|nr:LptF/LptG family permease [Spirochaetota bacterium]
MKKLHWYIIKEMLPSFFVGLGFFTFIFILNPILRLVDLIIVKHVDFFTVLKLFLFLLPSTIAIVIPMATLVAVLMAFGRLSSDTEVVAMKACGVSYYHIFLPVILFALFMSISGYVFNDSILPWGNYAFKQLYKEIVQKKPLAEIDEHTLTQIGYRKVGIDRIDKKNDIMYGIVIFEEDSTTGGVKTISAKTGKWITSTEKKISQNQMLHVMRLQLNDGIIQQPSVNNLDEFSNIPFKKMIINFTEIIDYFTDVEKGSREKTTKEIMAEIKSTQASGAKPHKLWVEFHKRFSIPFAALAFVLLGAPLGIISKRSGKSVALGESIVIIILYYLLYTLGESLGREGKLDALLALWIPNVLFSLAGIGYIYRISKT